jgi:hypothetical protein
MEGFSFVMPVTGLNRPNTGKVDDDDESFYLISFSELTTLTTIHSLQEPQMRTTANFYLFTE